LLPRAVVHPDLSTATALTTSNDDRAAEDLEIALGQCECFRDP